MGSNPCSWWKGGHLWTESEESTGWLVTGTRFFKCTKCGAKERRLYYWGEYWSSEKIEEPIRS